MVKFKNPADHANCAESYAKLSRSKDLKNQSITGPPVHPALMNEDILLKIFEIDGMCTHELMKCRLVCRDWARVAGRPLSSFIEKKLIIMTKDQFAQAQSFYKARPINFAGNYLDFLDNRTFEIGINVRHYRVLEYPKLRDRFFSHPQVAESIQQLWVTSRDIVGLLPELAKLPNLTKLTIVDPEPASKLITEDEMLKSAPTNKKDFESLAKLKIRYLRIECDQPQRSNHILKAILPMAPMLQVLSIEEDHACGKCYCLPVIEQFHVFKKLRKLCIGNPWSPPRSLKMSISGHFIEKVALPPLNTQVSRQNRTQLKRLLKLDSFGSLESLDLKTFIHLSTFAWRGIFQKCSKMTETLRELLLCVSISCDLQTDCDYEYGPALMKLLENAQNPEPDDFLAFFPKTSDGTTMKNLESASIKLLYDTKKSCTSHSQLGIKQLVLSTSRILPSLKSLTLNANGFVDVSNGLASAFSNLQSLSLGTDCLGWLSSILLNAPQNLKELTIAPDYSRSPIRVTIYDFTFLDRNCLLALECLEIFRVRDSCKNLTDNVVYQVFLKMKSLKVIEVMSDVRFSIDAKKILNTKFEMIYTDLPEYLK